MSDSFGKFHEAYFLGLDSISAARAVAGTADRENNDLIHQASKAAYAKLVSTSFGLALTRDEDLKAALRDFELGLRAWFELFCKNTRTTASVPLEEWALAGYCEDERKFFYWGRVGSILHHFRDKGRNLSTVFEKATRGAIVSKASVLNTAIHRLLLDPVVQYVYDDAILKQLRLAHDLLDKLQADIRIAPFELRENGANPFQDGDTIVRRQFVFVTCLMALELFGHVSPSALDRLLEIKSSTAEAVGLIPWPTAMSDVRLSNDSRLSMMRNHIRDAMKVALAKGSKRKWVTLPLITYFDASIKLRQTVAKEVKGRAGSANLSALPFW